MHYWQWKVLAKPQGGHPERLALDRLEQGQVHEPKRIKTECSKARRRSLTAHLMRDERDTDAVALDEHHSLDLISKYL
jgi:hypothetical protein